MSNVSRYRQPKAHRRHWEKIMVEMRAIKALPSPDKWHLLDRLLSELPVGRYESATAGLNVARCLPGGYMRHGQVKHARDLLRRERKRALAQPPGSIWVVFPRVQIGDAVMRVEIQR